MIGDLHGIIHGENSRQLHLGNPLGIFRADQLGKSVGQLHVCRQNVELRHRTGFEFFLLGRELLLAKVHRFGLHINQRSVE